MVSQTQDAFFTLAEMVSRHMTTIDQRAPSSSAGVQPQASGGVGTSIRGDRPTSHVPQSDPHVCTSCGGPCYGPGPRHGTATMTGGQALEEISTQNGPFKFSSNSMSSCVSQ